MMRRTSQGGARGAASKQALFEVDGADPLIYLGVSAILLLVAELASFLPARRATRIDPVVAAAFDRR